MNIVDPLAQSFYVDSDTGIFVTSLDLFFWTKDNQLPVKIQLRPMQLGLPTDTIIPFSEVILNPDKVNVSEDASVATKVTFESPVYLKGKQFYSIVLLANTIDYNVWVSALGGTDVKSKTIVTNIPNSGALFRSNNASTWVPSPTESLKYNLYRANFTTNIGDINFYNSDLSKGNSQIATLLKDSLNVYSRKISVGLGTTVTDTNLILGNTIIQSSTGASGNYVGAAGSAKGDLSIVNAGLGYTPSSGSYTYTNLSLQSLTGSGVNGTADITISNGVAIAATINSGGFGYQLGEVVTIPQVGIASLGKNLQLSIASLGGFNQLILDQVQGFFATGVGNTVRYINSSGITTDLNGVGANVTILSNGIQTIADGLNFKVNHKNHGMHSITNSLIISNVAPDLAPTTITSAYSSSSTSDLNVSSSTNFGTFEGVGIGTTNPGYALIGNEIIAYQGVSGNTLTNIVRGIDGTTVASYDPNTKIYKYELAGVSLRRINTNFSLQSSTVTNPIDLDYYYLKIDQTSGTNTNPLPQGQVDRSGSSSFPRLYFNQTKSTGGSAINATQNIPFEILKPNIQTNNLSGTNVSASVRTVTGKSISGGETSFTDTGFQDINLNSNNYFTRPRVVCSKVNENTLLQNLPAQKSFNVLLKLSTSDSKISPVIDLHRVSAIFTSNRINNPIQNWTSDNRTSTLEEDPSSFVYATNPIQLQNAASSLVVILSAYVNIYSDLRVFYALQQDPNDKLIYYPFPGYSNLTLTNSTLSSSSQVINPALNDGTSDTLIPKTSVLGFDTKQLPFSDYRFTINNLPSFRYFSIKLVGSSTNQSFPPRVRDFRVIALA